MFNYLFVRAIYTLVLILILFVIKTVVHGISLKKTWDENCIVLQKNLVTEQIKLDNNKEKLQLVEDLHKTLFNRLFKITRDIIIMQKLIFETHIK